MTTNPTLHRAADALRGTCEVHLPGDDGYDAARTPWNVAVDQRPAAVALPRSVDEVARVVRVAAEAGLRIAPQSTGHGAAALGERPMDDVVLVRLSGLTGVTVNPQDRTARVLGGTVWADVIAATAAHGLTALHGSAADVAVAGYALGGGVSFYGRQHGLAVNSIRAIEVVTADGSLLRASGDENAELFWALRGGGGNFGVVVAIELDLLPYADVYAGFLLWDRDRAPEVVRAWAEWTRSAPDSATTTLRVMSFPPRPELPPFLSGRDVVIVDGALLEADQDAESILAPLRALAPELDTFGRMPAAGLLAVHMDPPGPTPAVTDHSVLGTLDDEAVDELLRQVGPGTTPAVAFTELRHLGGAFARPVPDGGTLTAVPGEYALHCVAMAPTPQAAVAGRAAAFSITRAMAPWSVPHLVPTFTDTRVSATRLFGDESIERLRRIAATVAPDARFVANHGLGRP